MDRIKSVISTVRENKDVIISNAVRIGIPVAGIAVTFILVQKAFKTPADILEEWDDEFNAVDSVETVNET